MTPDQLHQNLGKLPTPMIHRASRAFFGDEKYESQLKWSLSLARSILGDTVPAAKIERLAAFSAAFACSALDAGYEVGRRDGAREGELC